MYYRIVSASVASIRDFIPRNELLVKKGTVPLIVRLPQGATRVLSHPSYDYSDWHELRVVVCRGPLDAISISRTSRIAAVVFITTSEPYTMRGLTRMAGGEHVYYQGVDGAKVEAKTTREHGFTTYDFTIL